MQKEVTQAQLAELTANADKSTELTIRQVPGGYIVTARTAYAKDGMALAVQMNEAVATCQDEIIALVRQFYENGNLG